MGASLASWLNDDSHFMIAITSYFKSDNKIVIYDYFGRIIKSKNYESLISADVYGNPEPTVEFKRPEEILKPEVVAAYVPRHLRSWVKIHFIWQNTEVNDF